MNSEKMKIAVVAGLVGASLTTGVQAFAQHQGHEMGGMSMSGGMMQPGAKQVHDVMMQSAQKMMQMKMPMDNDTDRMFAKSMADHHATGIKMAQIEIRSGNDPATKALARKIIAAQSKEKPQLQKLGTTARK